MPPTVLHRVNKFDSVSIMMSAMREVLRMRSDSHVAGNLLTELGRRGFYLGVADRHHQNKAGVTQHVLTEAALLSGHGLSPDTCVRLTRYYHDAGHLPGSRPMTDAEAIQLMAEVKACRERYEATRGVTHS